MSNASEVEPILDAMRRGDWDGAVPRARSLPEMAFPEIAARLEQSQDERERELCYRLLTHVAVSSGSTVIGDYAAKRTAIETRDRLIVQALEVVSWTGGVTHCQPVVESLASKNRDVNRWAIRALGACQGPAADLCPISARSGILCLLTIEIGSRCMPVTCRTEPPAETWQWTAPVPRQVYNAILPGLALLLHIGQHGMDAGWRWLGQGGRTAHQP